MSNSKSRPGLATTSPRIGTWPANAAARPPSVSTSSRSPCRQVEAGQFRGLLEAHARVGDENTGRHAFDFRALVEIMLVFDIADDHLDNILDRHQAVGSAVFVDHQGHMGARGLHLDEQVEGRHGGRREKDRAQDACGFERHAEINRHETGV